MRKLGDRWRTLPREVLLIAVGVAVYFGVRGVTTGRPSTALSNAADLVALEKQTGLYVERGLQNLIDSSYAAMTFLNAIYIWGHWPVIAAVLVWLFLRHPAGYVETRNTMLLSGGLGMVIFALYPVAPPRLANLGFVDTVSELSSSYRVLQPPAFVNQYAAMPSLHVGWDLIIGIALVTWSSHRVVRMVGVVLPVLMLTAVVLTGNHYIVDAIGGAVLVLTCRAMVQVWARRASTERVFVPAQRTDSDRFEDSPQVTA